MSRRWLVYLPLALTLAGTVALPTAAFAAGHDNPPAPACTKDTQQVKDLTTAVTNLGTAVSATTPDPTAISQAAGDIFNAITAAQGAGCLPALPTSPPAATPPPPAAAPMARHDAAKCATDTVQALTATLAQISAGTAATPDPAAVLKAANELATAITALNTDTCLPVSLPVPTVPAPPAPPTPPAT